MGFELEPVNINRKQKNRECDVWKATSAERSDSGDAIVIVIYDKDSWSFRSIIYNPLSATIIGILYYNITLICF